MRSVIVVNNITLDGVIQAHHRTGVSPRQARGAAGRLVMPLGATP